MAGVGAANQVLNLSIVVFNGLAVGTTALVARRIGAGDRAVGAGRYRRRLSASARSRQ